MKTIVHTSLLCLAALGLAVGTGTVQSACSFAAPVGWSQADTRWDGACPQGRAEGLGVLKELENGQVKRFFFGRLSDGQPELGAIDAPDGYVAGRFSQGALVPSDDRQTFVDAFRAAASAATKAAERFRKAGNRASARYYEAKAKELGEQMD